jgi:hypothetical protein
MLEYSEIPPVSSLYHEGILISEVTHAGQNPSSADGNLPVQPAEYKDLQKNRNKDGELSPRTPDKAQPGRERPRRGPARFQNPDPILPDLQIKISQDFHVKVIMPRVRESQWTGPTA